MAKTKKRVVSRRFYSHKTLQKEREYGFFWYSWLWKKLRRVLILAISLIVSLGIVTSAYFMVYDTFFKPMDPDDTTTVNFVINKGDYVSTIAKNLTEQGLLRNRGIFKYIVMFMGVTNDIQYGTYQISPSMSATEIINVISSGSSSRERTITIIPGWTVEDVANYLFSIGAITDIDRFYTLCDDKALFEEDFHQVRQAVESGNADKRKYLLEGYLAPDTYRILTSADEESILRTLLGQTEIVMDRLYAGYEKGTAGEALLDQDDIIILASMIEKEAATPEDMARVSAVFHNRLQAGMRLESDPTVKYISGSTSLVLTGFELSLENAYNTYVVDGLPCGPICNPSQAAIKAAMNPDQYYVDENYLYFCAADPNSGEICYSRTLEEHQLAVETYRPLWEAYDAEQEQKQQTAEQEDAAK